MLHDLESAELLILKSLPPNPKYVLQQQPSHPEFVKIHQQAGHYSHPTGGITATSCYVNFAAHRAMSCLSSVKPGTQVPQEPVRQQLTCREASMAVLAPRRSNDNKHDDCTTVRAEFRKGWLQLGALADLT